MDPDEFRDDEEPKEPNPDEIKDYPEDDPDVDSLDALVDKEEDEGGENASFEDEEEEDGFGDEEEEAY